MTIQPQGRENLKWSVGLALDHAFVWSLFAVPFSGLLWLGLMCLVGWLSEWVDVPPYVLYPAYRLVELLFKRDIISAENLPAAVMFGTVLPWMLVGWLFGFLRGWRLTARTVWNDRGVRIFSFMMVIGLLFISSMILWF
jgi:hypothetical protein